MSRSDLYICTFLICASIYWAAGQLWTAFIWLCGAVLILLAGALNLARKET
jgi:hypothetical protein